MLDSEAARLFADRVHSVRPDFALDEHTDAIFAICRAVEGLPLALELAAARVRTISPEQIATRLDNQLGVLRSAQKAGDLRHATLEATIKWSWDLLDDSERTLFGRLSVFRGTWALDAVEGICGFEPIGRDRVLDLLGSLVDKSLVVVDGVSGGLTRYRLLEPVRQYAAHRLTEIETGQLRARCIDYWSRSLTESWDSPPSHSVDEYFEPAWALEPDQANLTAAVEWAFDSQRYEDAMKILGSSFGHLLMLQAAPFDVVYGWIEIGLAHREDISTGVLLSALDMMSFIAAQEARDEEGLEIANLAMDLARNPEERLVWLESAAMATNRLGGHQEARAMFDRVIAEADDPRLRAAAMIRKTEFETPKQAWSLAEQAMDLSPLDAMRYTTESFAAYAVGWAAMDVGRYRLAGEMAQRSLGASRRTGYATMAGFAARFVGWVCLATGRLADAAAVMREAEFAARRILGSTNALLWVLLTLAEIERLQSDFERARLYVSEVQRIAEQADDNHVLVANALRSALIARDQHDLQGALESLDEAATRIEKESLTVYPIRAIISARAGVELRRGKPERALAHLADLLAEREALAHFDLVETLDMAGIALGQKGRPQPAARLLGAIDGEREREPR
jgi:hypothetical protein